MGFFDGVRDRVIHRHGDLTIEVGGQRLISRSFDRGAGRLRDLRPANYLVHDLILEEMRRYFVSEGTYASGGWAQLAESTVRQKQAMGQDNGILVRSGRMRAARTEKGHPDAVVVNTRRRLEVRSSVPYEGLHQGGTSRMPARPQQLRESARKQATTIYTRHFAGLL